MESFTNLEKRSDNYTNRYYRLDRMHKLLEYIGNPQSSFASIHIAGSKGKGSTAIFIASGLEAAGYKTGMYLSPHVSNYRERFTRCGSYFSEEEYVSAANLLFSRLDGFTFSDQWGTTEPTTFELFTAFSFTLFEYTKCEWAVIETGLGGRLDATNTLKPKAVVLTPIELEHTAILGNTITLIASEKAKIIKTGIPTFVSRQTPEALQVFRDEAEKVNSRMFELTSVVESLHRRTTVEGEHVSIEWKDGHITTLLLQMRGEVQAENVALALYVLTSLGVYIKESTETALQNATLPGRMEFVDPTIPLIVDGAHTVESLRHLVNSMVQLYGIQGSTLLFGALEGKDHIHMARLLLPVFDTIIISQPGTFKKSDPEALYQLFLDEAKNMSQAPQILLEKDAYKALHLAQQLSAKVRPILATGSFYLAGDVKKAYELYQEERRKVCL
jgi:dihydrofolate synthase/folylpolyglutamate synthase